MTVPDLWYETASDTRELANRERAHASHPSTLGLALLVAALLVAMLLVVC